jgi:hypothetical protein
MEAIRFSRSKRTLRAGGHSFLPDVACWGGLPLVNGLFNILARC